VLKCTACIDGVFCMGHVCDKQTCDMFQQSCLNGVRNSAYVCEDCTFILSCDVSKSYFGFYARKQLMLSACLSHRNSVCPSVTRVDQSKTVQDRITKSSQSAAWKTLVSGTVKLFHKFEGGHPKRGR